MTGVCYEAVDNGFVAPEPPRGDTNIGALITSMTGGNVQAVGAAQHSEIHQILSDPVHTREVVEALVDDLVSEVKAHLKSTDDLMAYLEAAQALKEETLADSPRPGVIKMLLGTLGFLGDIDGTLELMAKVWPYLQPLLMVAAVKLASI